jgi:histone acetyltransferase (RNA polymerase elongator complex component)
MIIPFFIPHAGCPHQCVFCDQKNITGRRAPPPLSSVPATIGRYLQTYTGSGSVQVAFYGGSFTGLPLEVQQAYLEPVQPFIEARQILDIRLSTRPDGISDDVLALLKRYHVGTVELGVQSMDDDVLLLSGRGHTAADTVRAVQLLRKHGFTRGLQLMPGLPGDKVETFQDTVRQVVGLRPDFVRIYPALVIRDTPLAVLYRTGRYAPLSLDAAITLCRDALDHFEEAGIEVIRVGLQATDELATPGTVIAGPCHPAFRQIVESSRFLIRMEQRLPPGIGSGPVTFRVNPADLSTAIGQNRENIHAIRDRHGLDALIVPDPAVPKGAVRTNTACNGVDSAVR